MRLATTLLSFMLFSSGILSGYSREAVEPQPFSVLLITVDTLRSDRVGAYGYARAKTPAIDRFASEGALFENVYCDIPWTTASMASIMTGLFNTQHGLRDPGYGFPLNN